MLQRINELAVKGENGTLTSVDRSYIQSEVKQLMSEIDRVQSTTTFNEQSLLDGTFTNKGLQVGAEAGQHIAITIANMNTNELVGKAIADGVSFKTNHLEAGSTDDDNNYEEYDKTQTESKLDADMLCKFYTFAKADMTDTDAAGKTADPTGNVDADAAPTAADFAALNAFAKHALKTVSQQRSDLGAIQNRLEHTISNLDNIVENTTAAESQIRDTDMATEMVRYSNNNILTQAGQAMLAQANQSNQGVLSLLG